MSQRHPRVFWWFAGTAGGFPLLVTPAWLLIGGRCWSGRPPTTIVRLVA